MEDHPNLHTPPNLEGGSRDTETPVDMGRVDTGRDSTGLKQKDMQSRVTTTISNIDKLMELAKDTITDQQVDQVPLGHTNQMQQILQATSS